MSSRLAILIGTVAAGVLVGWYLVPKSAPADSFTVSEAKAKSIGFSSADAYADGLKLLDRTYKDPRLSDKDFETLEGLFKDKGEAAPLVGLKTLTKLQDPIQLRRGVELSRPCWGRKDLEPLLESVFAHLAKRDRPTLEAIAQEPGPGQAIAKRSLNGP